MIRNRTRKLNSEFVPKTRNIGVINSAKFRKENEAKEHKSSCSYVERDREKTKKIGINGKTAKGESNLI